MSDPSVPRPPLSSSQRPSVLRRMDLVVVPRLQRASRAVAHGLGAPVRALTRWERRLARGSVLRVLWPRRRLLALLTVLVALAGSAVHFQRYPELLEAREAEAARDRQQTVREPGAAPTTGGALPGAVSREVGPPVGTPVGPWIEQRQQELATAPAEQRRLAVVSFEGYMAAQTSADVLPDGIRPRFAQYRLPDEAARPVETEIVAGDLVASVDRALATEREEIVAEETEAQRLLDSGTVNDPDFEADLRRRIDELTAIRNLLDSGGKVVFAVVVEGVVSDLQALAATDGVRLVDLAPPEADLDGSVFYGLLPEDTERVSYGRS